MPGYPRFTKLLHWLTVAALAAQFAVAPGLVSWPPPAGSPQAMPRREKIGTGTAARYIRRDSQGRFTTEQVEVGRSLSADRRRQAKSTAKPGYGDRGDRKR